VARFQHVEGAPLRQRAPPVYLISTTLSISTNLALLYLSFFVFPALFFLIYLSPLIKFTSPRPLGSLANQVGCFSLQVAKLGLQCWQVRRQDRPDLRTVVLPALQEVSDRAALTLRAKSVPVASGDSLLGQGKYFDILLAMFQCPITRVRAYLCHQKGSPRNFKQSPMGTARSACFIVFPA
jgi:hypothetical protein